MKEEKKPAEAGPAVSRREFLTRTTVTLASAGALPALAAAADTAAGPLPTRVLGRTGASVPVLAFGCGSRFLMYEAEDAALAVLERALALGVRYLDTAIDYGNGKSESRVGQLMKTRRADVFLATKIPTRARTRDLALAEVEASLKRLQTDHVDLLHIHSLGDAADLEAIEAKDGVLQALYELRRQKVARFIGMTSHTDGAVMARAIERNDIDCVQMAMNPARANAFEEKALPAAKAKNLGIILMKATGQEQLLGPQGAQAAELMRYAWSLPVATAVVGMPKLEFLEANVAAARAFAPMTAAEMDDLHRRLQPARAALEGFFATHRDVLA
jgi:aryl-alcohol dehydrogenase-like predicted oxidoreductase